MELTHAFIYEKTKEYVPGWCFRYTHGYGGKRIRREEVVVQEAYPHHIIVNNGKYSYSISRYDLFVQKYAKQLGVENE